MNDKRTSGGSFVSNGHGDFSGNWSKGVHSARADVRGETN